MSQRELALAAETTQATISRIENGKVVDLRVDTLIGLSRALCLTPGYICGWHEEQERMCREGLQ